MTSKFKANQLEIKVINYLINSILKKTPFDELDLSFLDNPSIRGTRELCRTIYGTIRAQLALNPNDIDGFSIIPLWVRKVYQAYRQTDYHDCWQPNAPNFESIPNMVKDIISVQDPVEKVATRKYGAWYYSSDNGNTLHLFPFYNESDDFKKGFLSGVKAKKLFYMAMEDSVDVN